MKSRTSSPYTVNLVTTTIIIIIIIIIINFTDEITLHAAKIVNTELQH